MYKKKHSMLEKISFRGNSENVIRPSVSWLVFLKSISKIKIAVSKEEFWTIQQISVRSKMKITSWYSKRIGFNMKCTTVEHRGSCSSIDHRMMAKADSGIDRKMKKKYLKLMNFIFIKANVAPCQRKVFFFSFFHHYQWKSIKCSKDSNFREIADFNSLK